MLRQWFCAVGLAVGLVVGLLLAGLAAAQEITTGVPIHPHPYADNLPLMTWECSSKQLGLANMLEFRDVNGSVNGYVDCHGNIHGATGGGAPAPPVNSVQFNYPLGTFDGSGNFVTDNGGNVDLSGGGNLEIDATIDSPGDNFWFNDGQHEYFYNQGNNGVTGGYDVEISNRYWPQLAPVAISTVAVSNNILTVVFGSTAPVGYGGYITFSGLTSFSALNGQTLYVAAQSGNTIQATFTNSDYGPAGDTGSGSAYLGNGSLLPAFYAVSNYIPTQGSIGIQTTFSNDSPNGYGSPYWSGFYTGTSGGARKAYGLDVLEAHGAATESAGVLIENSASAAGGSHDYGIKVNQDSRGSAGFYVDTVGNVATRGSINLLGTTAVGACTQSVGSGLSDCTASLSVSGGGPPASETFTLKVCTTGVGIDTFDYSLAGSPTCKAPLEMNFNGGLLTDDVAVIWGATTGHTAGDQWTVAVTVATASINTANSSSVNPGSVSFSAIFSGPAESTLDPSVDGYFQPGPPLPQNLFTSSATNGYGLAVESSGSSTDPAGHTFGIYSVVGGASLGDGGPVGVESDAYAIGNSADLSGFTAYLDNSGPGTVNLATGLLIQSIVNNGGGAITNGYGIKVDGQTSGVNNWAIATGPGLVEFGDLMKLDPRAVALLPAASASASKFATVSDSTAVVAEGQACVGGGSSVALAFSDGTIWKCF